MEGLLHQGETWSELHHCIFMRLIAYKMHYIHLFEYYYHVRVSFLDTLGSSLHEPRVHHITFVCIRKLHHAHKWQYNISLIKAT